MIYAYGFVEEKGPKESPSKKGFPFSLGERVYIYTELLAWRWMRRWWFLCNRSIFTCWSVVMTVIMGTGLLGSHAGELASFYNRLFLMQGCYMSSMRGKMEQRDFRRKFWLSLLRNPEMTLGTLQTIQKSQGTSHQTRTSLQCEGHVLN